MRVEPDRYDASAAEPNQGRGISGPPGWRGHAAAALRGIRGYRPRGAGGGVVGIYRTVGSILPSATYDTIAVYSLISAGGSFGMIARPIPSGRYSLMRYFVPGSRSGRTVLVEERKIAECAYTIKLYLCRPPKDGKGLKSENPNHPDIEISEGGESQEQRYVVVAEFVQVLNSLRWAEYSCDSLEEYRGEC